MMPESVVDQIVGVLRGSGIPLTGRERVAEEQSLEAQADKVRTSALTVRTEGLPFGLGEYLAEAADWWGRKVSDFARELIPQPYDPNTAVRVGIEGGAVVELPTPVAQKPSVRTSLQPPPGGFVVRLPGWEDLITVNHQHIFDERTRSQMYLDIQRRLRESPTPPGTQELSEILTQIDNVQDVVATGSTMLMVTERLAGRLIPGVGLVATAADALNLLYALSAGGRKVVSAGFQAKRLGVAKASGTLGGYAAQLENLRTTGRLSVGLGFLLQGLQATDTLFGTGLQLGSVVGYVQDAFWGVVRGATFELPRSIFDPVGLGRSGSEQRTRSPVLDQISPLAYYVLVHNALSGWASAARLGPWLDVLGPTFLTDYLVMMRQAEGLLGPWLRSGKWVEPVAQMRARARPPTGYSRALRLQGMPIDELVPAAAERTRVAVQAGLQQIQDPQLSSFLSSLATSVAWGLWGSVEPHGLVRNLDLMPPWPFVREVLEKSGSAPLGIPMLNGDSDEVRTRPPTNDLAGPRGRAAPAR